MNFDPTNFDTSDGIFQYYDDRIFRYDDDDIFRLHPTEIRRKIWVAADHEKFPGVFKELHRLRRKYMRKEHDRGGIAWKYVGDAVKKIGLAKIWRCVGGYIEDHTDDMRYQVISFNHELVPGRWLLMVNPSTKEVHIEGVPGNVYRVAGALRFRNQRDGAPILLT